MKAEDKAQNLSASQELEQKNTKANASKDKENMVFVQAFK